MTVQPTDVLTTIAQSLVRAQRYADVDEALRALAVSETERKINRYRRRVRRLERRHGMTFEDFTAHLRGKATIEDEDDWFEWKAALSMLADWRATKEELKSGAAFH